MTVFYPDVNVVHLLEATFGATDLDAIMARTGHQFAIGTHLVYELARGLLYDQHIETVRRAFSLLATLKRVVYLPPVEDLLRAELYEASTGTLHLAVLSLENERRFRDEVEALAAGEAKDFNSFIRRREAAIRTHHPEIAAANAERVRAHLAAHPEDAPRLRTFNGYRAFALEQGAGNQLVRRLAERNAVTMDARGVDRILHDPAAFPALTTWLNGQFYLAWIAGVQGATPSRDKLDDYRHLIEAARCQVFVTHDAELLRRARDLRPDLPMTAWDEFRSVLEAAC
jgi:hypothetical protein